MLDGREVGKAGDFICLTGGVLMREILYKQVCDA